MALGYLGGNNGINLDSKKVIQTQPKNNTFLREDSQETEIEVSRATIGHKINDYLILYDLSGNLICSGKVVGLEEKTGGLVLERYNKYRLTSRGYIREEKTEEVSIAAGLVGRVIPCDLETVRGLAQQIPLADFFGKDIALRRISGEEVLGRVMGVFPNYTYLCPYVNFPNKDSPFFRLVSNTPFILDPDKYEFKEFQGRIENFVAFKNNGLYQDYRKTLLKKSNCKLRKVYSANPDEVMQRFCKDFDSLLTREVLFNSPKKRRKPSSKIKL